MNVTRNIHFVDRVKLVREELSKIPSKDRKRENAYKRHYLSAYLHEVLGFNLMEAGRFMGKNHATIINSLKTYKIFKEDNLFLLKVGELKDKLPITDREKELIRNSSREIDLGLNVQHVCFLMSNQTKQSFEAIKESKGFKSNTQTLEHLISNYNKNKSI